MIGIEAQRETFKLYTSFKESVNRCTKKITKNSTIAEFVKKIQSITERLFGYKLKSCYSNHKLRDLKWVGFGDQHQIGSIPIFNAVVAERLQKILHQSVKHTYLESASRKKDLTKDLHHPSGLVYPQSDFVKKSRAKVRNWDTARGKHIGIEDLQKELKHFASGPLSIISRAFTLIEETQTLENLGSKRFCNQEFKIIEFLNRFYEQWIKDDLFFVTEGLMRSRGLRHVFDHPEIRQDSLQKCLTKKEDLVFAFGGMAHFIDSETNSLDQNLQRASSKPHLAIGWERQKKTEGLQRTYMEVDKIAFSFLHLLDFWSEKTSGIFQGNIDLLKAKVKAKIYNRSWGLKGEKDRFIGYVDKFDRNKLPQKHHHCNLKELQESSKRLSGEMLRKLFKNLFIVGSSMMIQGIVNVVKKPINWFVNKCTNGFKKLKAAVWG